MTLKIDTSCIFKIEFKLITKRVANCFLRRAPCTQASTTIKNVEFLIMRLKNDALNVFMVFL